MDTNTPTTAAKLIGYIRVSTARQGQSGLGLDAQITALAAYAATAGGTIIQTYREVESGKNNARPQLAKAIAHAKRIGAQLVIAKLDRLARNVHFISGLMESGVSFVAADNPMANRLTVHILAAVAENEAAAISARTKAALAAAKARGTLLGSARPGHWKGRENVRQAAIAKAWKASAVFRRAKSESFKADMRPAIMELKAQGLSLRKIAERLNSAGHTTARGAEWTAVQVSRAIGSEAA